MANRKTPTHPMAGSQEEKKHDQLVTPGHQHGQKKEGKHTRGQEHGRKRPDRLHPE